jgi:hypothetical protein
MWQPCFIFFIPFLFWFQSLGGGPQVKTINLGGVQKEVVSTQFNSPLNLYSDESIAEAAMANKQYGIG